MKIAIFGYGSLTNRLDLERTLGRPVNELFPAVLQGWAREWNVVVKNLLTLPHFELLDTGRTIPRYVIALNVSPNKRNDTFVNGVLFEMSEAELAEMDKREAHYDRVNVTRDIGAGNGFDAIYTYTGKPEHTDSEHEEAIIPDSYIAVTEQGFLAVSKEWLAMFHETTTPPTYEIAKAIYRTNS